MSTPTVVWSDGGSILGTLLEDVPQEVVIDRWGIGSATLNYECLFDAAPALVLKITSHPDYPWLLIKQARIKREEANLARVAINFEGINPSTNWQLYSLQASTTTEPIETHPRFISTIGGTPEAPLNQAKFYTSGENAGKFNFFTYKMPDGTLNPKAGIKSYLAPSIIYQESWTMGSPTTNSTLLANIGQIDAPPTSYLMISNLNGRNFILFSGEAEQIGLGAKYVRKWRLSGWRGWDTDIYQNQTDP